MKQIPIFVIAAIMAVSVIGAMTVSAGGADDESSPIFGLKIPPGYRDWRLISVAHEEGKLNDLRAILGNDVAITASREGLLPFPDGTIIARLAWSYDPLEESSKAFGRPQTWAAGPPKNGVQFMVKDSRKYASTGGWGFAQFDDGKPPARRCKTPAFPATRSPDPATLSSTAIHLEGRTWRAMRRPLQRGGHHDETQLAYASGAEGWRNPITGFRSCCARGDWTRRYAAREHIELATASQVVTEDS